MRLLVDILKSSHDDCTNNGLSSKHDQAILIFEETKEQIEKNYPRHEYFFILQNGYKGRLKAVPFLDNNRAMFGGNFLYSCDSSFPSAQPIHIHDRYED